MNDNPYSFRAEFVENVLKIFKQYGNYNLDDDDIDFIKQKIMSRENIKRCYENYLFNIRNVKYDDEKEFIKKSIITSAVFGEFFVNKYYL